MTQVMAAGSDASPIQRRAVPEVKRFLTYRLSDDDRLKKEYEDFRDRAAYVYVTGTFPTHLRGFFTGLLRKATRYTQRPSALDARGGNIRITPEVVRTMTLDEHPMVERVRDYINHGFKIQASRGITERRPYSRVFMFRESPQRTGVQKITINIDGSVREGWE